MKSFINKYLNDSFIKNVSILASGTVVSQLVVILISPILSRMYSVDSFGDLALFTSVSVLFAVVSTGRYELAIVLPLKKDEARNITFLTFSIGFVISLFYAGIVFLLQKCLNIKDSTGFLEHSYSSLAPVYILFIAIYSGLTYWVQRKKAYKIVSISTVIQVISTAVFSLIYGFSNCKDGMILSLIWGSFLSIVYLIYQSKDLFVKPFPKIIDLWSTAKIYFHFPKYMTLSDLSLTASQQFTPIIFSALFSSTIVGLYSMANRMIRLPNIVITSAIGTVFRNDAVEEIRVKGNCRELYKSTKNKLILISLPTYLIFFIFSPALFELIFGEIWYEAGVYARIISVFLLFEFVSVPLNSLFYIRERQKLLMRIQTLSTIIGALTLYLGYYFFNSPYFSLLFFGVNSVFFSVYCLHISKKLADEEYK